MGTRRTDPPLPFHDLPRDRILTDPRPLLRSIPREQIDPRVSRVVELRFFTGLSERETAEALKISISTLKRDWNFAKAWLFDQLQS